MITPFMMSQVAPPYRTVRMLAVAKGSIPFASAKFQEGLAEVPARAEFGPTSRVQ